MTSCEWIICERSGRWVAALRVAAGRRVYPAGTGHPRQWVPAAYPRLREVRRLEELAAFLDDGHHAVALVEVERTNLAATLAWLTGACSSYPHMRCVALLDSEEFDHAVRGDVTAALWAAGAVEISRSPRQLQRVLAVGQRHAAAKSRQATRLDASQSIADWAWGLLPWQSAE